MPTTTAEMPITSIIILKAEAFRLAENSRGSRGHQVTSQRLCQLTFFKRGRQPWRRCDGCSMRGA
jgi:hypothetical protein